MKKLLPFLILFLIVLGCNKRESGPPAAESGIFSPGNISNLEKQFRAKIGKFSKKWQDIQFDNIEKKRVTIHLTYNQMPSSMREVEIDTTRVTQAILDTLTEQKFNPHEEWMSVFVHAQMHEKGATGVGLTRRFGKTFYNFSNDTIEFEAVTK